RRQWRHFPQKGEMLQDRVDWGSQGESSAHGSPFYPSVRPYAMMGDKSSIALRGTEEIMSGYIQVVTTTDKRDDALAIAQQLVQQRLAACVQILGPITSVYRWKGEVESADEWQCWAKSRQDRYAQIEQAIRKVHPYEEPEILAMAITDASAGYLAWLDAQVSP
ncbi:MAG: divalent-cation tolerance protein CutA, partial [Patescibacteria group bacterium]|nr:divalent-cation tolerance protein CutA [Patescibacteria group bacterium]